jgi:cation/acetate symporter
MATASQTAFTRQLRKYYGFYTGGFTIFVVLLAIAEQLGLPRVWIGYVFLFATIGLYAGIGIISRTADISEYYVAGRRVPALFNGMATGADWMSAASFIGMAGTLYAMGYDGLAFIMGWTGGYVLVALLLAPYLRKFGQFTIPDFLGARYDGNLPRMIGVIAAILASLVYVVAQIYGVGLIVSRFTGFAFGIGVFLGLGGILVCSFLGGMRAVTWTQVAQYIILIVAYLIPVVMLSIKFTDNPIPQLAYGSVLQKVTEREKMLRADPAQQEVREIFKQRAAEIDDKLAALEQSHEVDRAALESKLTELRSAGAPQGEIDVAQKALDEFPKDVHAYKEQLGARKASLLARAQPITPHATPFPGKDEAERNAARKNFLALIFCLMVGTAALPHILMRYYTTPSVSEARKSVFWSLFFIFLLYFTAPALAVLVKYDVYSNLVGTPIAELPAWLSAWSHVDKTLASVTDVNGDGILQLAELTLGQDIIVLATPEIAGLPYVISGLVAAGGLAAALSTADGLLLTVANALSHDVYYKMLDPNASTKRRVAISKALLLVVALLAAYWASLKPGNILFLVSAAFSLAASAFFPALVLGIFWKRATKWGAVAGMVAGLGVCVWYIYTRYAFFGVNAPLIWDIKPISAATFGVPVGFIVIAVVSMLTPAPKRQLQELVEHVRYPHLRGDIDTQAT